MAAQPDKKTVIKDLLELGKSKGQLSTKEILDALGELDFDPEQIEKFYDTLESQGVEIVEDFDDITIDDEELAKAAKAVQVKEEGQLEGIKTGKGFPRPFVDQILEQIGVEYVD